jgi:hypothetical protein
MQEKGTAQKGREGGMAEFDPHGDSKAFEAKVANLIAATRHLDVPQILVLRRLTLRDPQSRKWATDKQLNVVFSVILAKAVERTGIDRLREARQKQFQPLLPPGIDSRDEDIKVLSDIAMQMLGPPQRSEAESTQAGFEALLARSAGSAPPRTLRQSGPVREPPPLFAAQLGPSNGKPHSAAKPRASATSDSADDSEGDTEVVDFTTLFDDTICAYANKTLKIFSINGPLNGKRVPFLSAPEFSVAYDTVLRRFVLPPMRATRHVQALSQNYNWAEVGGDKLIEIIQGSEVNNPILHNWDSRWNAFRAPKAAKGKKVPAPKAEDNPWPLFREDATRCNYQPPTEAHLVLMQDIIRYEADVMAKAWRELTQLYNQEFSPSGRQDQAREGAFRDGIMKWSAKLPDHVGEHLAIKAHFEFPRADAQFMRKLINNFGRNDSERTRNAPFLSEFCLNLAG